MYNMSSQQKCSFNLYWNANERMRGHMFRIVTIWPLLSEAMQWQDHLTPFNYYHFSRSMRIIARFRHNVSALNACAARLPLTRTAATGVRYRLLLALHWITIGCLIIICVIITISRLRQHSFILPFSILSAGGAAFMHGAGRALPLNYKIIEVGNFD